MFKKPPSVKNLSVLRSSDRKGIIQQIVQSFNLEDLDQQSKNSLLPEGAQVQPPDYVAYFVVCEIHNKP
jgi:Pre-PUA-like domain